MNNTSISKAVILASCSLNLDVLRFPVLRCCVSHVCLYNPQPSYLSHVLVGRWSLDTTQSATLVYHDTDLFSNVFYSRKAR